MRERGAVVEDTFYANHFLCKPEKGLAYTEERRTRFWLRMWNAYAKRMTQCSGPAISQYMDHLRLTQH